MTTNERLYTRPEAAEHLGLSQSGLRKMEREGRGPRVTRIGRLVRYHPQSLREFIEKNTEEVGK
jgi:predicted DNA-binding transcriptional regulator AlpA